VLPRTIPTHCVPMGISLTEWAYRWQPSDPPRLMYYGGISSRHNQEDALRCAKRIMPLVWADMPNAELWVVGANPSKDVAALARDGRVRVTGYVESIADLLATATAVVCPWTGTYGFRSRLIEAMAVGTPVVASADAVYGMGLVEGEGLFVGESDKDLAVAAVRLLRSSVLATDMSRRARSAVESKFGFAATYGQLPKILLELSGPQEQSRAC
jgi:polysaccharide biosynthesis protein PslH